MTRHRVPKEVLDAEDGYCQIDVGCILENGHEGDCDLRAALPPEPPSPGRPMTIRETAEIDALTLPPHQRPAAVERMVAERTRAAAERGIEKALDDQVISELEAPVKHPKIRVEVPRNLRPADTNVYFDGEKLGSVVAVRFEPRGDLVLGRHDTYVVLRVRDADVEWPEGMDWNFGRFDLSVRDIKGFAPGVNIAPRR